MGKFTKWLFHFFSGKKTSKSSKNNSCSDEDNACAPKKKGRWSFGGGRSSLSSNSDTTAGTGQLTPSRVQRFGIMETEQEQSKHAMAVAAASAAVAEAALAAANAAAAVARLTGNGFLFHSTSSRDEWAAIKIQTSFRGYLSRRALRALKSLVRVQALFRGHRVRKQAAMTLRCMQALVKVQAHIRARRVRMSAEGQAVQQQLSQRRSREQARPRKSMDGWNASPGTVEGLQGKVEKRQAAAKKRERALAYAMSQQRIVRDDSSVIDFESDATHCEWSWLERWMAARPWENTSAEYFKGVYGNNTVGNCYEDSTKVLEFDYNKQGLRNKTKLGSTPESISTAPNTSSSNSTGMLTWPSPSIDSYRQAESSPTFGLSEKQPCPASARLSHPNSTPSISGRSSRSVVPMDVQHRGLHALKENLISKQEECVVPSANSSPAAYNWSLPKSARNRGMIEIADFDQKENFWRGYAQSPNYMTPTRSTKAKARSQSAPRQRPAASGRRSPVVQVVQKKRFSLPWAHNTSCSGSSHYRRSVSQLRTRNSTYAASLALDRSSNSLTDSQSILSVRAQRRRPFRF